MKFSIAYTAVSLVTIINIAHAIPVAQLPALPALPVPAPAPPSPPGAPAPPAGAPAPPSPPAGAPAPPAAAPTPPKKRALSSDVDVLNYALTLEHLENAFYREALAKYSQDDFANAGFAPWVRGRLEEVAEHEKVHVEFLNTALTQAGATPVQPCEYKFPYSNVQEFVKLAEILESVGTSAYNGGAGAIGNKGYLTAAASILAIEARHAAWINSAARKQNPWSSPFETPLSPNQVYTLASSLIVSCPDASSKLSLNAFSPLQLDDSARPGATVSLKFTVPEANKNESLYAVFLAGSQTLFKKLTITPEGGKVKIPSGLRGNVYVLVSTSGEEVNDENTVAGPAFAMFGFDSAGNLIA